MPQVPTKLPVHVTQNRAALPFIKETLFIEGSHTSPDHLEFMRRMAERFGEYSNSLPVGRCVTLK